MWCYWTAPPLASDPCTREPPPTSIAPQTQNRIRNLSPTASSTKSAFILFTCASLSHHLLTASACLGDLRVILHVCSALYLPATIKRTTRRELQTSFQFTTVLPSPAHIGSTHISFAQDAFRGMCHHRFLPPNLSYNYNYHHDCVLYLTLLVQFYI